jgi:hypothetical protein
MNFNRSTVAIIIPIYREPNDSDKISLRHLYKYLSKYDKYMAIPKYLDEDKLNIPDIQTKIYPNKYFINPQTYSKLMLTKNFYLDYQKYKYILIYQTDSLVFSDKLISWCNADYDYVGAPSFYSLIGKLTHKKSRTDFVLNGGFSLRKVNSFIQVLKKAGNKAVRYSFNEDGFWSFEAPKYIDSFNTPDFKTAISFAFEKNPRKCLTLNGSKLPFGCHAWERYDKDFWLPYLLK